VDFLINTASDLWHHSEFQIVEQKNECCQNACLRTILCEVYQNYQTSQFLLLAPHFFCSAAAGFNETRKACCGTGYLETAILCNEASIGTCADAATYLFWDSFHPTTRFYKMLADSLVEASDSVLRAPPQP
jgi:phospholipase/lecithinase/hemolysin